MKNDAVAGDRARVLSRCFLFRGLEEKEVSALLTGVGDAVSFSRGRVIYDRDHYRRSVGILLDGAAEAAKLREGRRVVLNRFLPSMMFGAAAVFGDEGDYVTQVSAAPRCTVYFLSGEELTALFRKDFRIAENYIAFLTQRIYFLNRKIDGFTLSTAEEKLSLYLLDRLQPREGGCGEVPLDCSLTELAQRLDIGRASLYRALTSFTQAGGLERRGKSLLIRDPGLLQRNIKSKT